MTELVPGGASLKRAAGKERRALTGLVPSPGSVTGCDRPGYDPGMAKGGVVGLLVLVLASGAVAGCSSSACECALGAALVALPATLPAPVAGVTTDAACTASYFENINKVMVRRNAAGSCAVRVDLTNGEAFQFSVEFRTLVGCCAPGAIVDDASVPELVDAGSGG